MDTLLKLLKDKKVADSYQFYKSCEYKLYFAETSFHALENIINQYQFDETQKIQKVYSDAFNTGVGKYIAHDNDVDFFGNKINVTALMDKLTMEIMGLLHNFFDTYAQWLNTALLGENALPIKRATLVNLVKELPSYPEYSSPFISKISTLPTDDTYLYIADFNNILKHRYQIYVQNQFDIFSVKGEVCIPQFRKDGRIHLKEKALSVLQNSLLFCKDLLSDSRIFIEQYYTNNECNYVAHRIYNPKTFIAFKNESDYRAYRSPRSHYYYIEVDPNNVPDKFQIMLFSESNAEGEEQNTSVECYNSPYSLIVLREHGTYNMIGILKPDDTDVYALNDEHELIYRQYTSVTSDYEHEMSISICSNDSFHYYPFLTKSTIIILNEE